MKKSDQELEAHLTRNGTRIEELEIRIEALNRDINSLLKELNVSPQQLSSCLASQEHFSTDEWDTVNNEKKKLNEKLLRELLNISNPKKTKEAYQSRNVQPHWLFVR